MFDPYDERHDRPATEAEAHVEWHLNSGVPLGQPGCPQDACHPAEHDDEEEHSPSRASDHVRTHTPAPDFPPADPDDLPF